MTDDEVIARERLGIPLGTIELNDCRLTFRRQIGSYDVWYIATGPLGTLGLCVIEHVVLRQIQNGRSARDASRDQSSRRRTRGWQHIRIDDDFVIAVRARGNRLSLAYLFGDGAAFGGGTSGLPTLRQSNLLQRAQSWLSGERGSSVRIARHKDSDKDSL